jgi:PPOX class probable F420-dependent enzyme
MTTELPTDVVRLLEASSPAHLATLMPDGSPHSAPIWVDLVDGYVAFQTSPHSRKGRNVAHDPRVAISLTNRDEPNDSAYLRGRVVDVVEGDRGWAIVDRLSNKYLGIPYPIREDRAAFLVEVASAGAFYPR